MDTERLLDIILASDPKKAGDSERSVLQLVFEALRGGTLRAAQRHGSVWKANTRVKDVILWAFRAGVLRDAGGDGAVFSFTDKDTIPVQHFTASDGRRIVPGGTTVRDGSHLAEGVIVMPPSYVNIGAWIGADTMIDSHVLVGSCAQIGARVHLSAGVQIGGVLEPAGALPVIIEDDVMVGGNCGIYEGAIIRHGAVIGTGVIINGSIPVYDLVRGVIYRRTDEHPLEIPSMAVVVQGSRPVKGDFAEAHGIQISTPVIVKYRDEKTSAAVALEEALR